MSNQTISIPELSAKIDAIININHAAYFSGGMSQRAALKIGRSACYHYKMGRDNWRTVRPWKTSNPQGPKTEGQCRYHSDAVRHTARNVAQVALNQWADSRDVDPAYVEDGFLAISARAENKYTPVTARQLLALGIEAVEHMLHTALRCDLIDWVSYASIDGDD